MEDKNAEIIKLESEQLREMLQTQRFLQAEADTKYETKTLQLENI